jgi:mannose-6-phosphate isomerase-like protein (cupin superfamily)
MISYAKLPLVLNLAQLQSDVKALSQSWSPHFNTKHYEGGWTVLSLRAPGGKADQIIPDLINDAVYMDTPLMESCGAVKELMQQMHCPLLSVRFLNLQAGAVIKPHRDHELAFENGEARLHFPVFTNDAVEFFVEEELVRMREGDCWYINANLTHSVTNKGTSDRIHLVIDCEVNDWLREVFELGEIHYAAPDNTQLLQVIEELRLQGTEAALRLAGQLESGL